MTRITPGTASAGAIASGSGFGGNRGGGATTAVQVGYTVADVVAKAVFGVLIYMIAARKTEIETATR